MILYRFMKYSLCAVLLLYAIPIFSQSDTLGYANILVEMAKSKKLSESRYWYILLHYDNECTGTVSHIDDPKYFLSPNGKTNPEAELEATLRSFFDAPKIGEKHPSLRFIARYNWLVSELQIDTSRLPYDPLPEFEKIYSDIAPAALYIIFPSGYIESPASMFGHTLLLIERNNRPWLKAMSVNYAAITQETFGPTFAFKGITGMYKGYFSYLPYYKKILEYNDVEVRDMWEYKFNFSVQEIRKLIMHMVELEGIYSNYYFIDENCGYNLLWLLEAARPELILTSKFTFACEPIDTLREIIKQNAIESNNFRPSKYKKIIHLASTMTDSQVDYSIQIGLGKIEINDDDLSKICSSETERAKVLDLAADYCQYMLAKKHLSIEKYRTIFIKLLTKRSTIATGEDYYSNISVPHSPESSHYSKKAGLSVGFENQQTFSEFQFRITSHELLDDERGLNKNSQLVFGKLSVRYYLEQKKLYLEKFDIVDIDSINPSSRFIIRNCIFLKSGITRELMQENDFERKNSYYITFGPGVAYDVLFTQVYCSPLFYASFAPDYDYNSNTEFGARLGFINELGFWKGRMEAQYKRGPFINVHDVFLFKVEERVALDVNTYLVYEFAYLNSFQNAIFENKFSIQHCFH